MNRDDIYNQITSFQSDFGIIDSKMAEFTNCKTVQEYNAKKNKQKYRNFTQKNYDSFKESISEKIKPYL